MSEHSTDVFETRAKGKLLLSGEYFVLDGALALALPVRFGQTLHIEGWKEPGLLSWSSKNENGIPWYLAEFELPDLHILTDTDRRITENLTAILKACQQQNPGFLNGACGYKVYTQNDFPRSWGLGTSSTLIAAVARWAKVDPYRVLFETMGGSGYDIACAYADKPLTYRLLDGVPATQVVDFQPVFSNNLYFVYLDKKQDSRAGIQRYRTQVKGNAALLEQVSDLTLRMVHAGSLAEFEQLMDVHERLVQAALDLPRVQELHFSDYWGTVKSLGAWGGDFVLAAGERTAEETRAYFEGKGFGTVLEWGEMVE